MRKIGLSLAAVAALGMMSSVAAMENTKVNGQIKLWYETNDAKNGSSIFDQATSIGDLVAKLGVTTDATANLSLGATMYAATSLGLENDVVGGTAVKAGGVGNDGWPVWLGEAYAVFKGGNTIVKIGRQELNTPLAYSEDWNAAPNTFEAAVLINKDLPDTTLVAAFVSKGNGQNENGITNLTDGGGANAQTVNGGFDSFWGGNLTLDNNKTRQDDGGAYALGMVNTSIPGVTLHPVFYHVADTANALWMDVTVASVPGVKIELAGAYLDPTGVTDELLGTSSKSTTGFAAQVSTELQGVKLALAGSVIGEGTLPIANTATNFKKTKFYTASILADGTVAGQPDSAAVKLSASTKVNDFDLSASYGIYSMGNNVINGTPLRPFSGQGGNDNDPTELDLVARTKVAGINVAAMYMLMTDSYYANFDTLNNIRVIASIDF